MILSFGSVGDNALVAAVPGKRIELVSLAVVFAGDAVLTWKSGTTPISGGLPMKANGSIVLDPVAPDTPPWISTNPGEALVANLSLGVTVAGWFSWRVV